MAVNRPPSAKPKTNMTTNKTPDLVTAIINQTMRAAVDIIKARYPQSDLGKVTASLKAKLVDGIMPLVAEMDEASKAFNGNNAMLSAVLNAGCAKMALDAVKESNDL